MYSEMTKKELLERLAEEGYKVTWNTKQLPKAKLQDLLADVMSEGAFVASAQHLEELMRGPLEEPMPKIKKSCFHQN